MAKKESIETLKKKHAALSVKLKTNTATTPDEIEYMRVNTILTEEADKKAK